MSDISGYFSLQDRIAELEAEINATAKRHDKKVKALVRALARARLTTQRALLKDKRPEWALRLIKDKYSGVDITFKDIAKETRMSYKRVVEIANDVRKGLR